MSNRSISRIGIQAAGALAALTLAACGNQPYPQPSEAPPPPPPQSELMGGPNLPPPPPPSYADAQGNPAPGPQYVPQPAQQSGPVIIAMAPIPNPPEPEDRAARRTAPRTQAAPRAYAPPRAAQHPAARPQAAVRPRAPARAAAPPVVRPAAPKPVAPKPVAPKPVARKPVAPQPVAPRLAPPKPAAPQAIAPKRAAPPPVAQKAAPPAPKPVEKLAPPPLAKIAPPPVAAKPPVPAPKLSAAPALKAPSAAQPDPTNPNLVPANVERSARLQRLEASLAETFTRSVKLTVPNMTPGEPAEVTLTLPADFADKVREQAKTEGLSDAAVAVNLVAALAGEGFTIAPNAHQSQPLVAGQPTEFHWTVTSPAPDPQLLRADVGGDMIGAGSDKLSLGTVTAASSGGFKPTWRLLGAGILVLIAAMLVAILARSGSRTARNSSASARQAEMRRNARRRQEAQPFNMSGDGP